MTDKTYLGDAVYVQPDNYGGVKLSTEDGIRETNVIFMEPEVVAALLAYLERLRASQEKK